MPDTPIKRDGASRPPTPPTRDDHAARLRGFGRPLEALPWLHWAIIIASLLLTLLAWRATSRQTHEKALVRFEREVAKTTDLVIERMRHYETALWAGTAFINSVGGDVNFETWREYARGLSIERKYPGINGIGVIHRVPDEERAAYLAWQREQRPGYDIRYPAEAGANWPISYIVPVKGNEEAVGLNIAYEGRRADAARVARDTGKAQITGPIALVQDERSMPGFLFYAPFYGNASPRSTVEERRESLRGLVYAPFVVEKLMDGALARERRNITFSLRDDDAVIYTENQSADLRYDPNPLFTSTVEIDLYGRDWIFDFRSSLDFRREVGYLQPMTILVGGLAIDALLLVLFVQFSRSARHAQERAQSLMRTQARLAQANEELSQFNYRTSHDLVAPLKSIQGYVDLAQRELEVESSRESIGMLLNRINRQALRLDRLVQDLLELCRSDQLDAPARPVDLQAVFDAVWGSLESEMLEKDVALRFRDDTRRPFWSQEVRIRQILENLVSNGIKYSDERKPTRWVEVRARDSASDGAGIVLEVEDNGIGIPKEAESKIFDMFYRVGNSRQYGSGLGAYLVKKHVSFLQGRIGYTSDSSGTCFSIELPSQSPPKTTE